MEKLTAQEYREITRFIAHTVSEYSFRATTHLRMKDDLFIKIRNGISDIIERFHPSGHNQNIGDMQKAIASWIKLNHSVSEDYWLEVWIRAGRKDLGAYNGPKNSN